MQKPDLKINSGARCWDPPVSPDGELLRSLDKGPWKAAKTPDELRKLVARLRRDEVEKPAIFVGMGTCGLGAGAAKTMAAIRDYIKVNGIDADLVEVGCVGICSEEPIVDVQLPGRTRVSFGKVDDAAVPELLQSVLKGVTPPELTLGQFRSDSLQPWKDVPFLDEHPFLAGQRRFVLAASGILNPCSIDEYIATGGYSALAKILRSMTPEEVCDAVFKSGLRGRGGGGFSTGQKWKFARAARSEQKYLICNADEGDPGAFMDRAVGESDPHRLLEGMIIAAYAIGASKAYIYIRAEYPIAVKRLRAAIADAQSYGFIGKNLLGSGFSFNVLIKMGAGAFVCGEETALINSIEGKRGMPRPRPPFPAVKGLFDKPTVINNVETLANLPALMNMGHEVFSAMGTDKSKGTKVFALSGMVQRTGLVEVPMGTTLRQVVFGAGGGIPNNKKCKAVQIGGPSGGCIPEQHLDIECDYDALKAFGAIMGSGGLVVLDENTCMVDLAKFFMEFIQSESCGKCIPCREGTRRMLEILEAITHSRTKEKDLEALERFQGIMQLKQLGEVIQSTSLCGLGQTAPNPVLSTLRWFRDEYEAHIFERRCPAGVCKQLVGAPCETGCPVGTEVWRYVANIAKGDFEEAYRVVRQANPFPSVCARVCHHPCEAVCRCGATGGEPIAVRSLKRFLVENVEPTAFKTAVKPAGPEAKRVAIIGAGPAGLTAAHCLSVNGIKVTVFEREAAAGGMLVCAIPAYRLPRDVLAKEIESLLNENTEIKYNTALGRDITIDGLFKEGYSAIYVAMGSHQSRKLEIPGENAKGVYPGVEFLKAYNLHGEHLARGNVGVVGGGNSAIDAARVAIRLPGVTSVTVYYRRTEKEMPAYSEEIEAAIEEGVQIRTLVAPVEIIEEAGAVKAMRLIRCELGEPDSSGRRSPVPIKGTEFAVELDTIVAAISEQPDAAGLEGVRLTKRGTLEVNPDSFLADRPGVFGGGDVVRGPNTVIGAISDGKNAAAMIERYLKGYQLKSLARVKLPSVYVEPVESLDESEGISPRLHAPRLPAAERTKNFKEVERAVSEAAAMIEARRCLRCDLEFTQTVEHVQG
ncbi:MAG: FAD-dependent oxidoreductase [Deltaproteobacteria bacterium]|nr:FAD-dependent oxidoreductase [Deltaproteobacteria bacterium]